VRIGRRRPVVARRHLGSVIGIIRAGAIDGGRKSHRRQQFCPSQRPAFYAAFAAPFARTFAEAGCGFAQGSVRGSPIGEDAEHARIGSLAGQRRDVKNLIADDNARARTVALLIGCQFITGGFRHRALPCIFTKSPATKPRSKRVGKPDLRTLNAPSPLVGEGGECSALAMHERGEGLLHRGPLTPTLSPHAGRGSAPLHDFRYDDACALELMLLRWLIQCSQNRPTLGEQQ
jgi:hypothetical protein